MFSVNRVFASFFYYGNYLVGCKNNKAAVGQLRNGHKKRLHGNAASF